jgi:hypothetical protein
LDIDGVLDAAERLARGLRRAQGIDQKAAEDLKAVLRHAIRILEPSPSVPKRLANLFVDLASSIKNMSHAYSGTEAEQISYLADEIGDLVRQCVE